MTIDTEPGEFENTHDAANSLVTAHEQFVTQQFGTATKAGRNELWLPFHAPEIGRVNTNVHELSRLMYALKLRGTDDPRLADALENLHPEDRGALLLPAALYFGDMHNMWPKWPDDFQHIHDRMYATGAFTDRDHQIVDSVIQAASVKFDENKHMYQPVDHDSPFAIHQMIVCDAILAQYGTPDTVYDQLLLSAEKMMKERSIEYHLPGEPARPPQNLQELVTDSDYDHRALRTILHERQTSMFTKPIEFHLPVTQSRFPYHPQNSTFFSQLVERFDQEKITFPQMIQGAR